jgi:crossover junction endodeoxyribonuclease RuvC
VLPHISTQVFYLFQYLFVYGPQQQHAYGAAGNIVKPYFGTFVQDDNLLFLKDNQIILGIDPGTLVMGYGLILVSKSNVSLIEMGVLHLAKYKDHAERLHLIFKKMESLIQLHKPVAVAIEAPFFGKNVQSMLKLGRAQGVAMAAAMMSGLQATEYSPRKVKQSVTGRGSATKEQVWDMVQHTLDVKEDVKFMDAADAVAVALCHHYQSKVLSIEAKAPAIKKGRQKKTGSWESFIAQNPERIK